MGLSSRAQQSIKHKLDQFMPRAEKLLSDVNTWESTAELAVEQDARSKNLRLLVTALPVPPANLEEDFVALIHDIAKTFDQLAWDISDPEQRERNPQAVQFPIITDEAKWETALARKLPGLNSSYVATLLSIQPFERVKSVEDPTRKAEDFDLAVMRELDNLSKHRADHEASLFVAYSGDLTYKNVADEVSVRFRHWSRGISVGDELVWTNLPPSYVNYGKPGLKVVFQPSGPMKADAGRFKAVAFPIEQYVRLVGDLVACLTKILEGIAEADGSHH